MTVAPPLKQRTLRWRRPTRSWQIGDVVVHRIDEAILPPPPATWLLPDVTPEQAAELAPTFRHDDGSLRLATHSFAVESEGRRILVDTAVGNHKQRANPAWHDLDTDWFAHAEAAGFGPGAVDLVVMTHVHADHVGWNTTLVDGAWVPTFPGVRHLAPAAEWVLDVGRARAGPGADDRRLGAAGPRRRPARHAGRSR
ncbi:MBL fold metallo-hydrolase [Actinomycetospora soli]|uniref:MBL fold metallo-hydrolase n=1 Tax=Actinomycetospora soli TaxID=2893887 RepID=UPI0021077A4A|nr:MBL fold metallo-hydrolase [Actinomycetospora soli]